MRLVLAFGAVLAASPAAADGPQRVTIPALHADGVVLTGYLQLPAVARPKAPAMVLMHGCGGPVAASGRIRPRERSWMERFSKAGYAALLVDSFNPRGVSSTCGAPVNGLSAEIDRPYDAYAALRWLKSRPDIDSDRVALMGWSHGGTSVLSAAAQPNVERLAGSAGGFVQVVAFYPGCRILARGDYRTGPPVLMHLGGADDWTPIPPCENLVRRASGAGGDIRAFVYPGAHHGFDQPSGEVRQRKLVSGRVVSSGADPAARDLAVQRTMETLAARFASGMR